VDDVRQLIREFIRLRYGPDLVFEPEYRPHLFERFCPIDKARSPVYPGNRSRSRMGNHCV